MNIAAVAAVVLLAVVAVFQAALALGAPWGVAAWGGRNPGVLPRNLRIASGIAAVVIYPLLIAVVLAAAGMIEAPWLPLDPTILIWAIAGLLAIGAVMNFASRSAPERMWGPVALLAAVSCAIVGLTA
jgi:hypothetical protein